MVHPVTVCWSCKVMIENYRAAQGVASRKLDGRAAKRPKAFPCRTPAPFLPILFFKGINALCKQRAELRSASKNSLMRPLTMMLLEKSSYGQR